MPTLALAFLPAKAGAFADSVAGGYFMVLLIYKITKCFYLTWQMLAKQHLNHILLMPSQTERQ